MIILNYLFKIVFYYYMVAIPFLLYKKMTNLPPRDRHSNLKKKKLMIVFGSGGHTTEMLLMLTKK